MAPDDRWYDQSWGLTIDRTIKRCDLRPIVRSIVAPDDRFLDRTIFAIGPRCDRQCLLRSTAARNRIRRSISTRGRAITNDWIISMARAIVGNRATSGSDQQPMSDQLLRPTTDCTIHRGDQSYPQSWRPATDGTINRCILRPIERAIVAYFDRAYDQSWHPTADRTINRGVQRSISRCSD